jgi:hypothetical protein
MMPLPRTLLTVLHEPAVRAVQPSRGFASTTEVATCSSGIVQYVRSSSAVRARGTSSKPWRR